MRFLTRISLLGFCLVAVQLVRCGEGTGNDQKAVCAGALPPIIYEGEASDEAIERVWDKRCTARQIPGAATLTEPAAGAAVGADTPPMLRWTRTIALAPGEAPFVPAAKGAPSRALHFGLPVAWAHLPPVTGWVYLVELRPAGGDSLWLFTTLESWRPDPIAWRHLARAGEVEVEITSAYLNQNVIEEGPWLGTTESFRIGED